MPVSVFSSFLRLEGYDLCLWLFLCIFFINFFFFFSSSSPLLFLVVCEFYNDPTPYARSFRRRCFTYHNAMKHPHTYKYYLIMIKHSFSPKMSRCRKKNENRFTNKKLMSKNVFLNRDFV